NISGNTLDNTSMGIRAGRFSNVTISDNIIMNGLQNGIYLNQGGNATVFGNTITNQGHGLTVQKMEYVDINNNLFQNLSSGYTIRILDSNNTQFNDNLLTENNPQYWILDVQNSCNNTIKGNSFLDNPSLCIALTQKSNDNIIMNNYLLNNTNNIMLDSSDRNILRNNTMINGSFAITLGKSDHCIIENNTITGQDTGISISSSNNNTIKKNIITDNEVGIQLRYQDSKFNNITNNSVTYNTDRGIYLNDVSCTNYVSNNEICYNQYGLSLNKADNNEIFSNEISFNYYGIHFVDSDYNEIFDNSVHDNTYGMFYDPSNGNNIEDNTVKNNKYGIIIEESDSNTIINNIISENEIGIQIEDSDNNILIDNSISENDCGIQIDEGSTSNTIHHNSFIDNEVQAQDEGDSTWDDGEGEGNYWSDYIGSDGDNDGVGDNPYQSLDENPLMIPNQNAPPVADIGGPYYGYEGYETTFDASGSFDANSDPLKYRWDFNDDGIWDTGWSTDPTSTHKWTSDYSGYVVVEVSDGTLSDTDRTKILSMSPYQLKDDAASDLKAAKSGIGSIDKELDKIINNITASLGQKYWVDDSHLDPDNGSSIFTQDNVQISKMEALIVQYQNEILQLKKKIELYEIKGSDTTGLWSELKALEKAISALESAISKLVKSDELIVQTIIDENEGLEAGNSKYQKVVDNYLQKADEDMEDAKDDLDDGKINQALLHFKNAWEYIQKALEWADKE
ncbi:MAG: right-handed parallel beta-helix repeat-containing protein, partial [Candidatus Thermoplasmatota archaeon]|nr:right-handed parallel beta-helix repeat-containing protein [Candidatus Thermoplasmatota archaeon]